MGEDELVWKSGQAPMLRGSGSSGDGEGENALFSIPPHPQQQPSHQHFFFNDHEIASRPHHHIFYTQPQSSVSLATPPPPPSVPYDPPRERITGQFFATEENLSNLRGNIITGAGPWIPVVRESTQVGSSSAIEYPLVPVMESTEIRLRVTSVVSQTFVVPSLDRKEKTVVIETKAETEQIQIQPAMETTDETKRKEREGIEETEEAPASTSSRKRSRAAEMHNLSARRRREKINDSMKDLQELIPRCNKSDKASMLEDAVQYMKSLQMQIQMISTGSRMMRPRNMQPHMAMGMNRPPFIPLPGTPPPFPSQSHMAGLGPAYPPPHYPFPAYDPSRIHIPPSQQPNPVWNQPQFPGYMNLYSQFVGLQQQIQQPPPLQNQPIPQLSLGQASSSKEPEDQENQPRDE